MAGVGGNEAATTRRLPSWMVPPPPENKKVKTSTETKVIDKNTALSTQQQPQNKSYRVGRKKVGQQKRKERTVTVNQSEIDEAEAELTVQDLLNIAKEYVDIDADADADAEPEPEPQLMNNTHCESQKQLLETKKESNSVPTSLTHPAAAAAASSSSGEKSWLSTADPAQDMLDLFLGPLLKKPPQQENKTEFAMEFSEKVRKPSGTDVGEEIAPPMKTKSSLRDKVAMLLD